MVEGKKHSWALKILSSEGWVFEQGRKKSNSQKKIKVQAGPRDEDRKRDGAGTSVPIMVQAVNGVGDGKMEETLSHFF